MMIVNSRRRGQGGYGRGMDRAVDNIRRNGRVTDVHLIDVQQDLP